MMSVAMLYQDRFLSGPVGTTIVEKETTYGRLLDSNMKIDAAQNLIRAIDETLWTLGQRTSQLIYGYLEERFALKKEEIPAKPETFSRGLRSLFGYSSKLIELSIVKRFYSNMGLRFQSVDGFDFGDYIAVTKAAITV